MLFSWGDTGIHFSSLGQKSVLGQSVMPYGLIICSASPSPSLPSANILEIVLSHSHTGALHTQCT